MSMYGTPTGAQQFGSLTKGSAKKHKSPGRLFSEVSDSSILRGKAYPETRDIQKGLQGAKQ